MIKRRELNAEYPDPEYQAPESNLGNDEEDSDSDEDNSGSDDSDSDSDEKRNK